MAFKFQELLDQSGVSYDPLFAEDLVNMITLGLITDEVAVDLVNQIILFEAGEDEFITRYPGRVLAIVAGDVLVADSRDQAVALSEEHHPDRLFYLVEIPISPGAGIHAGVRRRARAVPV